MTLTNRFWSKVVVRGPDDCWLWQGAKTIYDKRGYGHISVDGKLKVAHHVAWYLEYGVWPEDKLLHRCDTPLCVNTAHLFEGTQIDNMADMKAKGREPLPVGEANGYSVLTEEIVIEMRGMAVSRTQAEIAKYFGVSKGCVKHVLRRRTWKHVA